MRRPVETSGATLSDKAEIVAAVKHFVAQTPEPRALYLDLGRAIMQKLFRRKGLEFSEQALKPLLEWFDLTSVDDLYLALGQGLFPAYEMFNAVFRSSPNPKVVALPRFRSLRRDYRAYLETKKLGYTGGHGETTFEGFDSRAARAAFSQAADVLVLGAAGLERANPDTARRAYVEARSLYRLVGDVRGEAFSVRGLAGIALAGGDYSAAEHAYDEALALFRKAGSAYAYGQSLCINGRRLSHYLRDNPDDVSDDISAEIIELRKNAQVAGEPLRPPRQAASDSIKFGESEKPGYTDDAPPSKPAVDPQPPMGDAPDLNVCAAELELTFEEAERALVERAEQKKTRETTGRAAAEPRLDDAAKETMTPQAQQAADVATDGEAAGETGTPRLKWKKDKEPGEKPPQFIARAYATEIKAGTLHKGVIHSEDLSLYRALFKWLGNPKNKMPDDLDLPRKEEWDTRQLDALGMNRSKDEVNKAHAKVQREADPAIREILRLGAVAQVRDSKARRAAQPPQRRSISKPAVR